MLETDEAGEVHRQVYLVARPRQEDMRVMGLLRIRDYWLGKDFERS